MNNMSLNNSAPQTNGAHNEKSDFYQPQHQAPPPAYNSPPPAANWPPLAQATALYAYTSTDAGDLELQPNDHITVTEYMNAEWWKGRSSRTGQEGIFPRSYVKVVDEKGAVPQPSTSNNYGNMPLETSQMGNGEGKVPSKGQEAGKKFGKKLGTAHKGYAMRRTPANNIDRKRCHLRCRRYHRWKHRQLHLLRGRCTFAVFFHSLRPMVLFGVGDWTQVMGVSRRHDA